MVAAGERVSGRTADPYKFGHSLWGVADSVLAEVAEGIPWEKKEVGIAIRGRVDPRMADTGNAAAGTAGQVRRRRLLLRMPVCSARGPLRNLA